MVSLKSLSLVFCYFLLGSLPPDRHRPAGSRQTNSPKLNPKAVDHGQVHSMSHTSSMPVMSCPWGAGGVPQQPIFRGKVPAKEICINHDGTMERLEIWAPYCCQALPSCKLVGPLQKFVNASHKRLHGQQLRVPPGKRC